MPLNEACSRSGHLAKLQVKKKLKKCIHVLSRIDGSRNLCPNIQGIDEEVFLFLEVATKVLKGCS